MRALLLAALVLLGFSQHAGAQTMTLGSTASAARADSSSNYVDWWLVRAAPTTLISVFGYNSDVQQFMQIYDSATGPTVAVTAWDATGDKFICTNHGLTLGQRIQLTGTVAGISAGIYYVGTDTNAAAISTNSSSFYIYDTLAHAQAFGATGRQDLTNASSTATLNLLPIFTQAIAATDNFFAIVPTTGLSCSKGLVLALSTTGPTYTASTKVAAFTVTFRAP